jgi:predicted dienelactone hydrolase
LSEYNSSASFYARAKSEVTTVGVVDNITLKDDWRDRELPLKIYYPQEEGSFPVIIFSHGAGGSKESFSYLSRFWSSCGYVCLHPTHFGSDLSVLQEIGLQALLETTNDAKLWLERPQDITFLIDSLGELQRRVPQLKGKINQSLIGVSGHSYGAYTTMLLAGAMIKMPEGREVTFRDDRAKVFLAISPQGTERQGLNKRSWDRINVPMMMVSGSKDQGWEGKPASWRLEAFNYMQPGDKYHVLVEGANHFSFDLHMNLTRTIEPMMNRGNRMLSARHLFELDRRMRIKAYLQSASIAFWDAYLKSEKPARDYLNSDSLSTCSNGEVEVFLK